MPFNLTLRYKIDHSDMRRGAGEIKHLCSAGMLVPYAFNFEPKYHLKCQILLNRAIEIGSNSNFVALDIISNFIKLANRKKENELGAITG